MPRPRKPKPVSPVAEDIPPEPITAILPAHDAMEVVLLKVLRPVPNPRLVRCAHPDGREVLLQVRNNANWLSPLEVSAIRADDRPDLYAVVGERAGRDPRTRGRWKLGHKL